MRLTELLHELHGRDIRLYLEEGRLRCQAPPNTLSSDLRSAIKAHDKEIRELLRPKSRDFPKIERVTRAEPLPLSFAQQRLWFLDQLNPGSSDYNIPIALRLRGELDVTALERSFAEVLRRHEILRTSYKLNGDLPAQHISDDITLPLLIQDLSDLEGNECIDAVRRIALDDAQKPFDLARGPMLRTRLLVLPSQMGTPEHVLVIVFHHIVTDDWSSVIFFRDLAAIYAAVADGGSLSLKSPTLQYVDFAIAQRKWLQGEILEEHLSYWRTKLAGSVPILDLPTRQTRFGASRNLAAELHFHIPEPVVEGIRQLSQKVGITQFVVLLAAFYALLYRYTGQRDISIGTPIANRNVLDVEELMGFFVNTLVMRADLSADPRFMDFLAQVQTITLEAQSHQDLPFERLVEDLRPHSRDVDQAPLFQVMFGFHNIGFEDPVIPGFDVQILGGIKRRAAFDLVLHIAENGKGLRGWVEYDTEAFDAETMERFTYHYQTLLEGVVANPENRLSDLPMLSEGERRQLIVEWNDTSAAYPENRCVHELFEGQAARTPEAVAVVSANRYLTYSELDSQANQLAHYLRGVGVGPETVVGICMERSPEIVIGFLGILKAGGAYLPLDPDYSTGRIAYMIDDANSRLVLTQDRLADRLPATTPLLRLDTDWKQIATKSTNPLSCGSSTHPQSLAYVMYTSGSTGNPNGVMVPHRAIVQLVINNLYAQLDASDCMAFVSNTSFDAATMEIWSPLLNGGRIVVIDEEIFLDPLYFEQVIEQQGVTALYLTAAIFKQYSTNIPKALGQLRFLFTGGEVGDPASFERVLSGGRPQHLIHCYGPTETTTFSITCEITVVPANAKSVPIGRPISNTQIYVLDDSLAPVPIGVSGELYIGGAGLSRGYLERSELTAERFVPNPFGAPGERMYRAGDIARYKPDGNVEFLGRVDHQVKIRGFRIELGEIEAVLGRHPSVREATVIARASERGEKWLVAYLVAAECEAWVVEDIRTWLRGQLPDYMVPSAYVILDALPLTANGKVDRKALPAPDLGGQMTLSYVAPRTQTEELLSELWAEVLGVARIGVRDIFFELGGHSLLATQVISRIRRTFDIDLPLRSLFEYPTVAGLAPMVDAARLGGAGLEVPALVVEPRKGDLPLSYGQQRLWFLDRLQPGNSSYHISAALRLTGVLDISALRRAVNEIVRRHEALRTSFEFRDGEAFQRFSASLEIPVPVVDLRGLDDARCEEEAKRIITQKTSQPFDLSQAPLLRVVALDLGARDSNGAGAHIVAFTMHHIISDGWSTDILIREVAALYEAYAAGEESPLPALTVQYADYAAWQRAWLQGEVLQRQLSYWWEQLAGAPPLLELPTDRPRPSIQDNAGGLHRFHLSREMTEQLRRLGRKEGATLFMTLLAGFQLILSRYSGQKDICIGTVTANRSRVELEGLIGFFVNTLVLRGDLEGDPTFIDYLSRVRETALGAQAHQDIPFERLVEELRPARDMSHSPLFQVMFVLQNAPTRDLTLTGLRVEPVDFDRNTAKFDLSLEFDETDDGLVGEFEYATSLFDASTIARMAEHYISLLESIAVGPDLRLSELSMLSASERHRLLVDWNDTATEYPKDLCIHELFEAQACETPDAVAVVFEDQRLTYGELNAKANQLAHHLRRLGAGPETLVGVCVERSLEMIVGLLGVLKAGGAYLPLDPDYPVDRLAYMLADARPLLTLTQDHLRQRLPEDATTLSLDADWPSVDENCADNPKSLSRPQNLAYVIYTSGSTGKPKGVGVAHQNVRRLFSATEEAFKFSRDDVWTLFHSFAFDFSVWETWGALLYGGRLVIASYWVTRSPEAFYELLCSQSVTVLNQTPSNFYQLDIVDAVREESGLISLRLVIFGGEALETERLKSWFSRHDDKQPQLVNMYGITETTVHVTLRLVQRDSVGSIGRPLNDLQALILDQNLKLLPVGVCGELYIGGAGLARGYLNRSDLTAERFVPNPFGDSGERLYRTGDLARYRQDGNIEYLGRADHQVKIRGFRIELGEIEAALGRLETVREAVALAREDAPGDKRIVAYIVGEDGAEPSVAQLRASLASDLPDYMMPSAFVFLEALPLTPNGKIDRKALPEPDATASAARDYIAPRTPTEAALCRIWADVLGLERVGVNDNFFELGGHSILAVKMVERLRRSDLRTDVRSLFSHPTPAGLAAVVGRESAIVVPPNLIPAGCDALTPAMLPLAELTQAEIDRIVAAVPGGATNVQDIYPLAPLQEGILFHHLMAAKGDPYIIPVLLGFDTRARLGGFCQALQAVIARHDILRTAAMWDGLREPMQVVWREAPLVVEEVQLDPGSGDIAQQLLDRFSPRQFRLDVRRAPMMRVFWAHDSINNRWLLLLLAHHLAFDHSTLEILLEEAEAQLSGRSGSLPTPTPFRNFVAQARLGVSQVEHEAFFTEMLGDVTEPTAPFGMLDVRGDGSGVEEARLDVDLALAWRARTVARALGVSVASLWHQAFAQVLARTSGRNDVVFGTVLFGRMHGGEGADRAIGLFINTLPIRVRVGQESVRESARLLQDRLTTLLRHEHAPLTLALRCSGIEAPAPLFSALLNYRHSAPETESSAAFEGVTELYSQERTNYPLTLSIDDLGEGLRLTAQTQSPLNPQIVCGYMHTALEGLVTALETAPETPALTIDVLSASERHRLLVDWNDTATEYPKDLCIHELFEAQACETPDAVAVVFEDQRLTYGELNAKANQLAHHLRRLGAGPETLVGVCVERSLEMIVGLLGVLKAGGAYLPLDPDYPVDRLAYMLADARPLLTLTQDHLRQRLPEDATTLSLDADWPSVAANSENDLENLARPQNLAYVIYTSGSTGKPKGVGGLHQGVVRLVKNTNYLSLNSASVTVLHHSPLAFDASTFEIWGPLLNGARLAVAPQAAVLTAVDLGISIKKHNVTVLWLTAALFHYLVQNHIYELEGIEHVLAGGDVISPACSTTLLSAYRLTTLTNGYGPTENTTFSTTFAVDRSLSGGDLPIGKPIANSQAYVVDGNLNPVPLDVAGELVVAGAGLARGYLGRADLTAERFVPNPFGGPGERLYRTGDLARYRADGNIEFLGRADHQVKVRGFRIELGEIEAALGRLETVREAVALAREDAPGDKRIVAYIVGEDGAEPSVAQLRASLASDLPDYMIPSAFVFLEVLPLTPNGKVDRKALPAPDGAISTRDYVAPRTRLEEILSDIFSHVLGAQRIGIHDSFFHVGGNSLLAYTLAHKIRETLRCKLPLLAIFQSPSVGLLASYIEHNRDNLRQTLVQLREGTANPTLYCIHPAGSVSCYVPLAKKMEGSFPIYGLDSPAILDPDYKPGSIAEMAAEYSEIIRTHSSSPYYLIGWSMGGLIAHSIASVLESHDEEVAFLGILDTQFGGIINNSQKFDLFAEYLLVFNPADYAAFMQMGTQERRLLLEETAHLPPDQWFSYIVSYGQTRGAWLCDMPLSLLKSLFAEWWHGIALTTAYEPPHIHSNIHLWWARDTLDKYLNPPVDWRCYTSGNVNIHHVDGDHETIVHSMDVISSIGRCLNISLPPEK